MQIALAESSTAITPGELPLVLKLNGKTDIPSDAEALLPLNATSKTQSGSAPTPSATPSTWGNRCKTATSSSTAGPRRRPAAGHAAHRPGILPRRGHFEAKDGKDSFYAVD